MARSLKTAGAFAEEEEAASSAASRAALAQALMAEDEFEETGAEPPIERYLLCALLGVACLWLVTLIWIGLAEASVDSLSPSSVAKGVALASSPLVLVGVAALLLLRTSRREAIRFANVAAIVRAESVGLNTALSLISNRLASDRAAIAETAEKLMILADETSVKLASAHGSLARETGQFAEQAKRLDDAAAAARLDMGVLLADLPRAEGQTREMADLLRTAGLNAHEQAAALDATIASLIGRARDGEEAASASASRLSAHVARIEGTGEVAASRMDEAGRRMEAAIDTVLTRASEALEQTRGGVVAQGDAMMRLIEQAKVSLDRAGADSSAAFQERIAAMGAEMDRLAARIGQQTEASRALLAGVGDSVAAIEARLEKLESDAPTRIASLTQSFEALATEAGRIAEAIAGGETGAATLLSSVDTLRSGLATALEQLNGALPRALNTLESQAEHSRRATANAAPEMERLATAATQTAAQIAGLEAQLATIAASVETASQRARELGGELGEARSSASALSEAATGALVEALTRVRETAMQASLRAKEALAEVIPASAAMLAGETRAAFDQVMGEHVEVQLQRVAVLSERALTTANTASDRLGRQLARMAETAQSIDARVDEANAAIEAADRESFSRRSALLIEMLNANAIEIARALEADVGDDAWQAYVGGDRGTFTRRAVRLLETAEARKVGKLYESDAAFKEQANRYVRDFEAMLRPILLNRDGGALSVALLSSDMGKLYVALAQAMERLRS